MTYEQVLQRFGLPASAADHNEIRRLLGEEIGLARHSEEREEMLRVLCFLLFSLSSINDVLLIWDAKQSNFDASCGLEVQFLCGAGLQATKDFLNASKAPTAPEALSYLVDCEQTGDFSGFSPAVWIAQYRRYYGLDAADF
ncbi:MAG: hypothetical protein WCD79_22745 [Chthoniobacteraceae bacterium]